jgi:putative membrane protein
MGPEYFGWGGWWIFPIIMPLVMVVIFVIALYFVFGRGGFRPPWWGADSPGDSGTAMEILRKRYAKGEITREEFESMKKDLQG